MTKHVKLTDAKSLFAYIDNVFAEGIKSTLHQKALAEKDKQGTGGGSTNANDDLFGAGSGGDDQGGSDQGTDDHTDKPSSSKTMDDENSKLKDADVEPKDIVDKLNSIRSGKSFKDSAVKGAMDEWINSLSKTERVALFAFVRGIAQIVTGEVPAKQAEEPGKHPADIKMDKTNEPHTKEVRPNVIKGAGGDKPAGSKHSGATSPQKKSHGTDEENTDAPISAPIQAKRR